MPIPSAVALDMPSELRPDLSQATVRTCNLALGGGRCVVADANTPNSNVAWIARMRPVDKTATEIRVSLSSRGSPPEQLALRVLEFGPSDRITQRWETAGVVVAALVVGAETGEYTPRPASQPVTPTPNPDAEFAGELSDDSVSASNLDLRFDLAAFAGPGLDSGPWRFGGQLRGAAGVVHAPVFVWAGTTYARSKSEVSLAWWSGASGVGLRIPAWFSLVSIEARLGAIVTNVNISATELDKEDSESRWRGGGVGALDLAISMSAEFDAVFSLETSAAWPLVEITSHNEPVGLEPPLRWGALLGLRWIAMGGNSVDKSARSRSSLGFGALP